jgi:hypothetical protein
MDCKVLFADYMSLIIISKNYEELETKVNEDLTNINNWLNKNKLLLNKKKSSFMIMGRPPKNIDIRVFDGNNQLQRVYSTKILGITIDNNMNFRQHLENTCDKIATRLSYLSRVRYFLNLETLNKVFKTLILPLFDYGNVVWGHTYETHLEKLVKMQKKAATIITFSRFDEHSEQLFIKLNWMQFEDRIRLHSVKYIYKTMNGLVAIASKDFLKSKHQDLVGE